MSKSTERGQALILIALAAVGLFAFAALAIDGSRAFSNRRHAQNAADTAVLAAALAHIREPVEANKFAAASTAALQRAGDNGFVANGDITIVEVNLCSDPGITCEGIDAAHPSEYIRVRIKSQIPSTFGRVIGRDVLESAAEAIARVQGSSASSSGSLLNGAGMVATKSGNFDYCFHMNGNGNVSIHGSGISVNCSGPDAVYFNSASNLNMDANGLAIGCYDGNGGYHTDHIACWQNGTVSETIDASDFAGVPTTETPDPCTGPGGATPGPGGVFTLQNGNLTINGGEVTLTPGNFNNIIFFSGGPFTMSPGVYCIGGSFVLNSNGALQGPSGRVQIVMQTQSLVLNGTGGLNFNNLEIYSSGNSDFTLNSGVGINATRLRYFATGSGTFNIKSNASVTSSDAYFYLENGNIIWDGDSTIDLKAPTTGTFAGLLIYKPWDNPKPVTINGGANIHLTGTVLVPSSPVTFNSDTHFEVHSQIIASTFLMDSDSDINIHYVPSENFGAPGGANPTIQLTK